ncbi:Arc family DNA-binding protein [Streptomyces mirabilis]|uniref:TA system antitoxin ParD family protein n=1 Tax=Streptomyces mirabilis TaxID=68239 RepID=UPI0036CD23ED
MAIFNFRIPDDLYDDLKAAAIEDGRSVNSQLLYYVRLAVSSSETPNRPVGDSAASALRRRKS